MPERENIPTELVNWLRVACMGLTNEASRRVREEALARYTDIFDKEIAANVPESEARARAIKALGDPWQVHSEELRNAPANLMEWITIATQDLVQEAERRIRSEISEHYQDALEAALEAGLAEADARRSAIKSLGNPEKANKILRKSYLSNHDLEIFEKLQKVPQKKTADSIKEWLAALTGVGLIALISYFYFPKAFSFFASYGIFMTLWQIVDDRLEKARSRFVLNLDRAQARSQLKAAAIKIYSIVMVPSIGFIWVGYLENFGEKISRVLAIFLTFILVMLWCLLILRELDFYGSLMRKVHRWENDKEYSPDRYA